MADSYVTCAACQSVLPNSVYNIPEPVPCPSCGAGLRVLAFPALFRPAPVGSAGERLMVEGEASCFYHPQKKAVVPCDRCGRFLCGLCDVSLGAEHVCPACLQTGGTKGGKRPQFENRRTIYSSIAWALAVYPLLPFFWFFTVITAPAALFVGIWHWNTPGSVVETGRKKLVAAVVLASLQIVAWVIIILFASGVLKDGG